MSGCERDLSSVLADLSPLMGIPEAAVEVVSERGALRGAYPAAYDDPTAGWRKSRDIACVAKCLTATLANRLVSEARLRFDTPVADVLGAAGGTDRLDGVTVAHLLSHTHGLTAPGCATAPRAPEGEFDVAALLSAVAGADRLFAPGRFYSYSNLAYLLLGAVIVEVTGRHLAALVADWIIRPLGLDPGDYGGLLGDFCPAGGRPVRADAELLSRFLRRHATAARGQIDGALGSELHQLTREPRPLPGWSPLDQGHATGWMTAEKAWLGHCGRSPDVDVTILRFHPPTGRSVLLMAKGGGAYALCHHLMAQLCDVDFVRMDRPRLEPSPDADILAQHVGDYHDAYGSLEVRLADGELVATERVKQSVRVAAPGPRRLRPVGRGAFVLDPPGLREPQVVQFIADGEAEVSTHLWSGSTLRRRV